MSAVRKRKAPCSSKDVQGLGIKSVLDLRVLKKSCKREENAQAREEQEGRAKRLKAAVSGLITDTEDSGTCTFM